MNDNFKILKSLMERDRSVRRFEENNPVNPTDVADVVKLTRFCASGRNLQPLKYCVVTSPEELEQVYPLLKWAGYLPDWDGPDRGERPTAIVVQLLDTSLTHDPMCDPGLHLQAITLGGCAKGFNSCIIKAFNAETLSEVLNLPAHIMPLHVVAMGYPAEQVVIEPMKDNDVKYWRSPDGVHHVPKREVDIIGK